ncbi:MULTISPECIES: site-2 protease family protein [unclassified Streptomyces]|uniref:site-2 protease family protein n=1 Tax=unclassified Streptomyces TaxID=2593676 RepID=UPI002DDC1E63|nr:site-2 protease family protein [Streptomyces sp. NBC_01788]WSB25908.1 site-2 protease family protein [Streptomyces sp. NBC_01788]
MDVSGGSGQPRSGKDESADRRTDPVDPAPDSVGPDTEPADAAPPEPSPLTGTPATGAEGGQEEPTRETQEAEGTDEPKRSAAAPQQPPTTADAPQESSATTDAAQGPSARRDVPRQPPATHEAPQESSATGDAPQPSATGDVHHGAHPERGYAHSGDPAAGRESGARAESPAPAPGDRPRETGDHDRPEPHPDRAPARSGAGQEPPRRPSEPRGGLLMGRPFGVPVYVAPSWFLVAALITWVFGGQLDRVLPELGAARYLVALFFAVAFYGSVLVHELAHTIAALRFKLPVRRIQLQFFGGVSEIEKEAETPGREFVLAFVGPLLSLILAGVFYAALRPVERGTVVGVLLAGLMISNLIVAAFNLLPGLPLDGGRMLRAVVWKITGRPMSGTVAAAWVGRALAVAVLIGLPLVTQSGALGAPAEDSVGVGTVTNALLAAILAAIIWTGAGNSLRMARLREHLPELRARALTRRAVPVETNTSLAEALRRANASGARALVVVDGHGEPLSLVRESAIVGVPEHRRPWVYASELAQELTDGMRVSAELAGEDLLDALRAAPATEYLVVENSGEIYGVLSASDVERAFVKAMARPSASA